MRRMTVGMVTMTRRKTRFPTDIGSNPTEAKPTASVTAFCVYLIPIQHQRVGSDMHGDTPNRPTPPYYIYRAHLSAHPGERKSPKPSWCSTHHKQLFFYRREPDFFTAAGRFLNRGGCCRHAAHDGGDGDDGKEENSFSDRHWLQHHQSEADSIRHGFLCLPHPLTTSTNGGRQPRRYAQPPHSTLLYI